VGTGVAGQNRSPPVLRQFPGQERQVYEFYQQNPDALAELRAPLFEDKVVDYVLELADVKEKKVSREELLAAPDSDEDDEARAD
jgi:trigger factor